MAPDSGLQEGRRPDIGGAPRRRHGIITRSAGADVVLYDAARGRLHVLNSTAAFVWDLCDGSHPARDIAASMGRAFTGAAGHDTAADVDQILDSLGREDLLEESYGNRCSSADQALGRHA